MEISLQMSVKELVLPLNVFTELTTTANDDYYMPLKEVSNHCFK
jgi:hypothetical protein